MFILGLLALTAVVAAYRYGGHPAALLPLAGIAALVWWLDTETDLTAYIALLGIQLPVATFVFRIAISDFFMLPVIARWVTRNRPLPKTTLLGPFVALVGVLALGTLVAFVRTGQLGTYVLFNKDAGIVFLVLSTLALMWHMRTINDVRYAIDIFVIGASAANVLALLAAVLAVTVFSNPIFLPTSGRLYGWLLNPSSYGMLVVTAAMLELPRLGRARGAHSRFGAARWMNYGLLVLAAALTLSRSAWLALFAGAAAVLLLRAISRRRAVTAPRARLAAAAMTTLAPAAMLAFIAAVQWKNIQVVSGNPSAVADMEQAILVGQCLDYAKRNAELCDSIPSDLIEAARRRLPSPQAPEPIRDALTTINPDGALMNARGIEGRVTILNIGWAAYNESVATRVFGVGLGRFLGISSRRLGVPVIIHNTIFWFLVEMGPLGLAALLWLLGRTALNLWYTRSLPEWQGDLSHGLAAAFVAWCAFSLFNEALYVREFWLLLLGADRLYTLSIAPVQQAE